MNDDGDEDDDGGGDDDDGDEEERCETLRGGVQKKQLAWRRTQPYAVVENAIVNTIFARAPYVATASRMSPTCSGT
eukprot:4006924-Pyramimonas_sp.AAC.1